jgi:predicted dinucleotide-binding enzyme
MKIGILGAGPTGQTIASKLVQLGHDVMLGAREETFRLKLLKTKLTKPTVKIHHYELGQSEFGG